MYRIVILSAFLLLSLTGMGQVTSADNVQLLYRNEFTGAFTVHSNGISITARRTFHPDALKKRGFEVELTNLKHPKEVKTFHPFFENSRGYVFGKLNNFSSLRLGYGQEPVIAEQTDKGSIEIRYLYYGGLSLGLVKPVYLEILYPTESPGSYYSIIERYDPDKHRVENIYGRASFTEGLGEMSFLPGAYAKLGFNFLYSIEADQVLMAELGMAFDYFPTDVPIMAIENNKQFFTTYYISLHYGLKWNK